MKLGNWQLAIWLILSHNRKSAALIFPQLFLKLHFRTLKTEQEVHELGLVRVCAKEAWIFSQSFTALWHTFLILVIAWTVIVIVMGIVIVFLFISQVARNFFAETNGLSSCPLIFSVTRRYRSDVCDLLSNWLDVSIDLTDVTLVSEDTYRRLYWCDPDHPYES